MNTTARRKGQRVIFIVTFVTAFVVNFLLVLGAYSLGDGNGYDGEPSFSWSAAGGAIGDLFGGLWTLVILTGVIAALWGVHKLSKTGHHTWVTALCAACLLVGGFLLFQIVWPNLSSGFIPLLIFLVLTVAEAATVTFTISKLSSRNGRGTTTN